jgi:predicted O-methyltransferase YrrM
MNTLTNPFHVLGDPRAEAVLTRLHRDADRQNLKLGALFAGQLFAMLRRKALPWRRIEPRLAGMYLALDPANGVLCYMLARALGARRIVEFGTSFGVSTIYLALAVKHNGGGVVIGSEVVASKAEQARKNLCEAGVEALVDLRVGDALDTLKDPGGPVDFLMNDGFPRFTLPVLQMLAPWMRPSAIALCGNAALFPADHAEYLAWVRDPKNGFCSTQLAMTLAGELSVKVA